MQLHLIEITSCDITDWSADILTPPWRQKQRRRRGAQGFAHGLSLLLWKPVSSLAFWLRASSDTNQESNIPFPNEMSPDAELSCYKCNWTPVTFHELCLLSIHLVAMAWKKKDLFASKCYECFLTQGSRVAWQPGALCTNLDVKINRRTLALRWSMRKLQSCSACRSFSAGLTFQCISRQLRFVLLPWL